MTSAARSEIELPEVPALGGLYAQALGRSAQAALVRPGQSRSLPDVAYVVDGVQADPDHLAAYEHLLAEPGTDALPAGFVHVLGFPLAVAVMARPDFPLPLLGLVHTANLVEQHGQLTLGEPLTVRAWAADLATHRSGTQVDLVVEARRQGSDELAWRGVSTYLARGKKIPGLPEAPAAERVTEPPSGATGQWRLAGDVGRRYAEISGDRNPIHLWPLTAKLFGFPRAIAHGMYTASRALATVGAARGPQFRWTVDFGKPVLLPSTVAFGIQPRPDGGHAYTGWNARSGKVHFSGAVVRL